MFNASVTTGRVTGISLDHNGVVYKVNTLGRQYSWNNIIKHLDYDQGRDRLIVLENNRSNQQNTMSFAEIRHGQNRNVGGPENAHEKPEYHVTQNQGIGWAASLIEDNPRIAFRFGLDELSKYERRRRKQRGL